MGKGRRREAAALVIGQPEAASRPLFLEDAVLLHQVLDDALLVAVDPSREGHEQHPQRGGVGPHWPTLPGVGERVRDPGRVSGQYGISADYSVHRERCRGFLQVQVLPGELSVGPSSYRGGEEGNRIAEDLGTSAHHGWVCESTGPNACEARAGLESEVVSADLPE